MVLNIRDSYNLGISDSFNFVYLLFFIFSYCFIIDSIQLHFQYLLTYYHSLSVKSPQTWENIYKQRALLTLEISLLQ